MNLIEQLETVIKYFNRENIRFALAGGLATSIYRTEKRLTEDIDFLVLAHDDHINIQKTEAMARKVLTDLHLDIREARLANSQGGPRFAIKRGTSPLVILVGRKEGVVGVDLILPTMPWFNEALARAQYSLIDFSIGKIPCLTVEDVLIAKFFSLNNDSTRFKDADDIQSILASKNEIDFSYLVSQMNRLKLQIPLAVEKIVPPVLRQASKFIRREIAKQLRK